jgi:hypothetical protein
MSAPAPPPRPSRPPETQKNPEAATGRANADQPGPECLLAADLMAVALQGAGRQKAVTSHDPALAHIKDCAYCNVRYEALVRLHQAEPAVRENKQRDSFQAPPPLDSWSGRLAVVSSVAADAGDRVVTAATLQPNPACRHVKEPLYLELHWSRSQTGGLRCQVSIPLQDKNAPAGASRQTGDWLQQQWFMVELSCGDPNRTWGFDTLLQWDDQNACLVSPVRVLPVKDPQLFREIELTRLQSATGGDVQ